MLIHALDPVALSFGPIAIRWYGIMYFAAFLLAFFLLRRRQVLEKEVLEDLLFWLFLGIILGGRLGQVLFYEPAYFAAHPQEILKIWHGGMSFHGGFLGVLLAAWLWARKNGVDFLELTDKIAPVAPLGLMLGRLGNFINGELWGRLASPELPWAMIFPLAGDALPRHPVQIYQASLEGALLFFLLWFYSAKPRPRGAVSGFFLLGYGIFRCAAEFFREPDRGIFGQSYLVSMGQWLSLPMIACGLWLLWRAWRDPRHKGTGENENT
ncbi:MAG: prolipoprotein diacylglyceryl transferase [Zoogloeaceae bacterium]|jgi:phosphatidylglycerol:prolipoprotein diacylglycerol transferase|nr:prolipoprotein diacylglyceryl transferase [Zoogloeaceae bacterium]